MSNSDLIRKLESQALGLLDTIRILKQTEVASVAPPTPQVLAGDTAAVFDDYGRFYDYLRGNSMLGPKISTPEFEGCDSIIKACVAGGFPISYTAYTLATVYHESAHTMQPIKEYGGAAYYTRMYDIKGNRPDKARELGNLTPGDGARYAGRGYPQLTGKKNYAYAGQRLGVDLVGSPDLALKPEISAAILVLGMKEGWFTGRKLPDDLPSSGLATRSQFGASRDIVNGTDKADLIAGYAVDFQTALQRGGYKLAA